MSKCAKNYYSSSTICKKSQLDVFKITPTRRCQKWTIKKQTTLYIEILEAKEASIEKKYACLLKRHLKYNVVHTTWHKIRIQKSFSFNNLR